MRATAILGRSQNGYRWAYSVLAPLWIEIPQAHSGDDTEVDEKLAAELDTYVNGQTEITVGIDPPATDPVWGEDIIEGDEVSVDGGWREVEAYAVSIDDDTGRKVIVPQFGTVLDEPVERIAQAFRAVGNVNGGTSHIARPAASLPSPNNKP